MRVNIHRFTPQKANERLIGFLGEFDRQTARRRNRCEHRNTRSECLLNDLKRHATTHEQDVAIQWKQVTLQGVAENLVERVVAADVFAQNDQIAIAVSYTHLTLPTKRIV